MALNTNFNVDPYYDDFDEDKNYHRVLFKPGFAVQSRELTQSQTILQDQIKKFGNHMFKTGSVVTDGQITIQNTAYLNIASTYSNETILYSNYDKQVIFNSANTKRAYILKSYEATQSLTDSQPVTFVINQMYGDSFTPGEIIYTANTDSNAVTYYAQVASTYVNTASYTVSPVGNNQTFSINEGVFYYEGYFVKSQAQSIAIDKYSRTGNALIGFEVSESIVNYTSDTSLLDPAQSSSNYQAPGADRYKISLTLTNRPIDSTDLTQFIELAQIASGVPQKVVQTPIYASIGDEFARRTFDESGDYVVKEFDISVVDSVANTAYANVALGPGKAYIRGYEFGTMAPSVFSIPKPRTTTFVNNQRINSDYGYYIYANNLFGNFATNQFANVYISALDSTTTANLLLTGASSQASGNVAIFANTMVANARIKLMSHYSSTSVTDSNTYIYRVFLTDINARTIFNTTTGTGYNVNTGSSVAPFSNIGLPPGFANTSFTANSSSGNNMFVGATIRFTNGARVGDGPRIIVAYDAATRNVTVDRPYSGAINTGNQFAIDTDFRMGESIVVLNTSNFVIASANITPTSKDPSTKLAAVTYSTISVPEQYWQPVVIQESASEPLLIKIGQNFVADNTIADFSYGYKRLYQGVSFVSGVSSPLSIGAGESLQTATTNNSRQLYYTIIPTSTTGAFAAGYALNAAAFSVATDSRTLQIQSYYGTPTFSANVYATIAASNPTSKTKTYIKANTTLVATAGGGANDIFGNASVFVSSLDGQTQIASSQIVKTPGSLQSLYVPDVTSIDAVFDFNGGTINTTTYAALDKSEGSSANVTARYTLDDGQRDSYYDWSSIVLKPGQLAPKGPLLVRYNRFKSTGAGFFNVDSYTRLGPAPTTGVSANTGVDYGQIPIFKSQDGYQMKLADYLDFRPVRKDAAGPSTANAFVLDVEESGVGPKISEPNFDILTDYSYYLGRVDRVVVHKDKAFNVIQGEPAINPVQPPEPDNAMTLYILSYPPYLTFPSSTGIQRFGNKRYTMKDIGGLERRIQNLEYYTALTIGELATLQKQDSSVLDSTGLARPKNGFLVETFIDRNTGDITAQDFACAIDPARKQALNQSNTYFFDVFSNNSTQNYNIEVNGPVLTLASTNTSFIIQNKASRTLNINPFNIVNYLGTVRLDPASDIWKSENRLEAQNVDLTGGAAARDAYSAMTNTVWGPEEMSTGISTEVISESTKKTVTNIHDSSKYVKGVGIQQSGDINTIQTQKVKETTSVIATKQGVLNTIVPVELTKSLGDRLVNVTMVTYMRQLNVLVVATKFKPLTTMYSFFDNTNVSDKVARSNRFTFDTNNLKYQTAIGNAEAVDIKNAVTGATMGVGGIALTSNNKGYLVSVTPTASYGSWAQATGGINIIGRNSGITTKASVWNHYSGTALSATSSTIVLGYHAGGSAGTTDYAGQTIYILSGTGKGQSKVISSYDSATRTVTISGTWTTNPDSTSAYSIGRIETDEAGATAGVFFIPDATFRTGEKLFRLIDNEFGNVEASRSNGDASFYAQGQIDTKQETSISVLVPNVIRSSVSQSRVVSSSSSIKTVTNTIDVQHNVVIGYYDPLAQTFLVNGNQYPQGVVIDSIRVCFKSKDINAPVTLQLRPVVNGYPSSSVVYPYAERTLTPDQVTVCTIPDVTDATKYTEFKFDVPIMLMPGEHSFVLISNSVGYEAFVGEHNATDLRTSVKISEQPYTGVLFLSQNGSTWDPDDEKDLMFSIQRRVFSNEAGYAYFETDMTSSIAAAANTVFDAMQITSTDAVVANTDITYEFSTRMDAGGIHAYLPVVPNFNYAMVDGYGRRVLDWTTGNTTFMIRTTLQTNNRDVTPMLDISRLNLITIENKINNLPLRNNDFVLASAGSGYTVVGGVGTQVPLTITGGGGTGGAAYANVAGDGTIDKIVVSNPGTGYYFSPTISLSGTGSVSYNGEDKASGGNSIVRYLTKKVQLASGFNATDLRVYLDGYKPPGSGILVYYKVGATGDADPFENNNYQLMTQLGNLSFISNVYDEFTELTYAPGVYNSGLSNNKITYTKTGTTFNDFITFSVKVVMYGSSTVNVPKIRNLRIIALSSVNIPQGG